jgi:hypothetical protein
MAEQIHYRPRTKNMLKAALQRIKYQPVEHEEKVEYCGARVRYVYPFDDMRPLLDSIVIKVTEDPSHEYGRQKVKYRVRTQAFRRGIKISIVYSKERGSLIITKVSK